MKKNYVMYSLAAAAILATTVGVVGAVNAASGNDAFMGMHRGQGAGMMKGVPKTTLTDAEKTALQVKFDAIKLAEANGDYTAWVTAVKALDANSPLLKRVTSADSFKTYLENIKTRTAEMTARQAKQDAITKALDAKDYTAWVTAVKAAGQDAGILTKITADNFARYAEAYSLRKQANTIMTELGLENSGRGMGRGVGNEEMGGPRGSRGNMMEGGFDGGR